MVTTWRIAYRARKIGAIGVFEVVWLLVQAETLDEAARIGWDKIHETHEVQHTAWGPREELLHG